ncbi:glycosyltransferase family 2 protein [Flavobacterium sp.]|uniref:glycosyltransferase family 2 protein n=1 Tax=Flavobacterium sp. TaxID=239 RepID=UPI0025CDC172|nr:glycosyltransferase family 2 protein [Flavobacterium sp.]
MKTIAIIIPAFNEADNILPVYHEIQNALVSFTSYNWEVLFVNDGSTDKTLEVLESLAKEHNNLKYISFSRNFGKDNALKSGIDNTSADIIITMDADLQHPPSLIPELISKYEEGYNVVYAHRKGSNPHVSFFSKLFSKLFWKLLNMFSGLKLEDGISDFRLLDKKVIDVLKSLNESELFFRGMVKWVGFKQIGIEYIPNERLSGETNYSKSQLLKLAVYSITSFSTKPLYSAIYIGFLFSGLSILYIPYIIYSIIHHLEVPGWSSIIMTIVFFGGLQLIMLGVIGIYIGKLFMQAKERPNYIIDCKNF